MVGIVRLGRPHPPARVSRGDGGADAHGRARRLCGLRGARALPPRSAALVKTVAKAMASRLVACAFCVALAACSLAGPADHTYLSASGQQITPAAPAQTSPWAGPGVPLTKNKK